MTSALIAGALFRVALPIFVLTCTLFRPSLLSALYLLLLLYSFTVPLPNAESMNGRTGIFFKILIGCSVLGFLMQLSFQIVLLAIPPYGHFLEPCETLERIFTAVGLVRLDGANVVMLTTWISPEIMMVLTSLAVYILCRKLPNGNLQEESGEQGEVVPQKPKAREKNSTTWLALGKVLVLASFCFVGVLRPSVPGALYFLVFIGGCTWWACNRELQRGFAIVCRIFMVVVFLHFACVYGYQFDWIRRELEQMDFSDRFVKLMAIEPLFNTSCADPKDIQWIKHNWDSYVNPVALIWLFYILTIVSKYLLRPKLMRGVSPSRKYGARSHPNVLQDSTGSVTVASDQQDEIPLSTLAIVEDEEEKPGCFENTLFVMESLVQFIIQSSYVATNIIMMTWSITYHSWLTFVLLLWANILWMIPNQRRTTLRSSPFLLFYAIFLLLSSYVFSMNIDELPTEIFGIPLQQIGLDKVTQYPSEPLLIKSLFTIMFWITLRQHVKEIKQARQTSTLAEMAAPLQLSVTAATGMNRDQEQESQLLKSIGEHMKKFLSRIWIWIVAITLFAVAITGERMTVFRIIYMALFLFFIITFQLSFRIWLKMMFGFWLTVIIYSMLNLIMVYTYQFDDFDKYWAKYLHVPPEQQLDIGLERFGATKLFVRLAIPTFFVIVTVIQLHYFHNDFVKSSIASGQQTMALASEEGSSVQGRVLEQAKEQPKGEDDTDKSSISSLKIDLTDIGNVSTLQIKYKLREWWKKIYAGVNLAFAALEVHMHKLVLLLAMLMCIYDKCALYYVVVLFFVLGVSTGRKMQMFVIYSSSIFTSVVLLARMVYQIQYIKQDTWNVSCEINENVSLNSAEWLGFNKTLHGRDLPHLVRWNIAYILVVTLYTVVLVRQFNYKLSKGQPTTRLFFLFPNITRTEADKSLANCCKYLANFGYYKFGVEISLIATVALIGFRMDFFAILYSVWLCVLFGLKRSVQAKIWNVYLCFIAVMILLQYVMAVGLPPILCIDFPWDTSETLRKLQHWGFLMDYSSPPAVKKLLLDALLLIFVARQSIIFRIEWRYRNDAYPGGSNESIIHHAEEKDFVNPCPDFITYTRSYLDVVKRIVLLGFMWLTLAIVFLAGANRVNLFSLGYLVGSFIFLWQGSDIYLKPIPRILKSWNYLLGYNVVVILIKTVLQLAGCVFIEDITECWVIQLLGIGCVKQPVIRPKDAFDQKCEIPTAYIGLAWDGVCFAFLILQRRVFSSYNFFHMIDETKAGTILASRGAELIEKLRQKRMHEQDEQERRILEKIKVKMDKIKATQEKMQGPFKSTTNHYVDTLYPRSSNRPLYRKHQPKTYKDAIRSGDYYMFDDLDDDDDDLEIIDESKPADEDEDMDEEDRMKEKASRKPSLGKLLSTAMKTDIGTTLRSQRDYRRASMPLSRQRSTVSGRSQLSAAFSAPPIVEETDRQRSGRTSSSGGKRARLEEVEPKPGTSKDEELSGISEPRAPSRCQAVLNVFLFLWAMIDSALVSLTRYLNTNTRDYRYVMKTLRKERKLLKQTTEYTEGVRVGRSQIWQPANSYYSLLRKSASEQFSIHPKFDVDTEELSSYDQPTIVRFLLAIWYIVLSHSDILCYFVIFLNQIKSATFLSLPLPLMVFFWGTLTVPRPSKNFWITIIAYTQMVVMIKCIFQFEFLAWNQYEHYGGMNPAKIFGIERKVNYANWDLLLLLIVFFHRYLMKSLGLWKTTVTVVPAYTSGEYMVDDAEISPIKRTEDDERSPNPARTNQQAGRAIEDTRRDSDMVRLVEENEDNQEESGEYMGADNVVAVSVNNVVPYDMFPDTIQMSTSKYFEAIKDFFRQLTDPTSRVTADVYSYMFLCDFFNFFVILVGFSAFGAQQSDGGVSSYLEDNRVPTLFVLMLLLQFLLIIVDRAIFLRKHILAKIIFQFVQVFFLHIWLFILYPAMTERKVSTVIPPQMYYMVKCFYLLLSAYQIRCGYPSRILGNFICKGYNYVNLFLFKGFMLVPFLFELRSVMDWVWTDTSMTIFDWIKMEDIFAHIYQLKCARCAEAEYPQPRGEKKSSTVKYFMGGSILFIIIAIIWFPLVFFSLGNAVGQANPPFDVTIDMRIGPYEPIYHSSVQTNTIYQFSDADFAKMMNVYQSNKAASAFMANYEAVDIVAMKLNRESSKTWQISPPDRARMIQDINSTNPISIRFQYTILRQSNDKEVPGDIREENVVVLEATVGGKPNPQRVKLLEMVGGNYSVPPIELGYIVPKFLKITNRGTAKAVPQMMNLIDGNQLSEELRQLSLVLNKSDQNEEPEWWKIAEGCTDRNYLEILKRLPYEDCNMIVLYGFNDRIFPTTLALITGGGIIGVYTTLVFVASRFLRGFFSEICFKIMFDDMPNVDRVIQLCLDIYLVREARELYLEEDLFAKLVFLFRSPETLIRWTRPKEELSEDEDPEGESE